jgi:predicted amidohydrolase YtcJ
VITKFIGAKFLDLETGTFKDSIFVSNGIVTNSMEPDEVVELSGYVFPAFRDGHCHPLFAGREHMGPVVTDAKTIEEVIEKVAEFKRLNPDQAWIEGGAYDRSLVADGRFLASWLDKAADDVPIVLHASDHHTIWVNSKALELIPDPSKPLSSGSIDLDEFGKPSGVLREPGAMSLVLNHAPNRTIEEEIQALIWADNKMASFGIVEAQDAWIEEGMAEVYIEAVKQSGLKLSYNLAYKLNPESWREQLGSAEVSRAEIEKLQNKSLTGNTVKFFADGVFGSATASVLEPYLDSGDHGEPLWSDKELPTACQAAAGLGFQLHIHAIGDAGIRQALDAIEATQALLGKPQLPSVIAHVELLSDQDLLRFKELDVIANMQPLWAQKDGMLMSCEPRLGARRIDQMYRMRDLIDSGATLSFGSDWPVSSVNPLHGIATAVSRQTKDLLPKEGWVPRQRISLSESLQSYSKAVTYQLTGGNAWPLAAGEPADFIVLTDNLFELNPKDLREANIQQTYKSGKRIY